MYIVILICAGFGISSSSKGGKCIRKIIAKTQPQTLNHIK